MNLIAGKHLPPLLPYIYVVGKFSMYEGMCFTDAQKADICSLFYLEQFPKS